MVSETKKRQIIGRLSQNARPAEGPRIRRPLTMTAMHIIGTAGHVDHGKSSLVEALTGVNPDRWAEERERGMTLDLGFAHLVVGDVEAGIVDVPGHARFLHNMLAGAAGMELLLLVVAADDGVMPQTYEHLHILRHLNVQRTIVVVSKIDLLTPERVSDSVAAIREALRGSIAEGSPIVPVSTVSGSGLDLLRERIHAELRALPERAQDAPVYLPIDRVFALPGRGTIITGTLMQGKIAKGDTLAIEPLGARARIRGLQVFGEDRTYALPGTRVALNIPSIDHAQLSRGAVLADPKFPARASFAVTFEPEPGARAILRKRTAMRAYIGASEVLGTLRIKQLPDADGPFEAELLLREPVVAFPGVRFVVRRMSPKTLLGGGEIAGGTADVVPPDDLPLNEQRITATLRESGREPLDVATIAFRANLREEIVRDALSEALERGTAFRISRPDAYLGGEAARATLTRIVAELESLHQSEPWTLGATSLQLARALVIPEPLLVRMLLAFAEDGRIVQRAGYYALPSHEPRLSAEQRALFDAIAPLDASDVLLPAAFSDAAAAVKRSGVSGAGKAFDTLLARGTLVKVGDALYRGSQIANVHAKIETFIDMNGRMTMAEFRDLIGTSRKYAVPLLEWFDSRGITVRSGDYRMLRTRKGSRAHCV